MSILTPLVQTFCAPGGLVLDPFSGFDSSLLVAQQLGRNFLGIEFDPTYLTIASRRLAGAVS